MITAVGKVRACLERSELELWSTRKAVFRIADRVGRSLADVNVAVQCILHRPVSRRGRDKLWPLLVVLLSVGLVSNLVAESGSLSVSGVASIEMRVFPDEPLDALQFNGFQWSTVAEPEVRWVSQDRGESVRIVGFARVDNRDENRTHLDLREAYWERYWNDWNLLAGFTRVFWGVAESQHLVDVVNQIDAVEDIDGETRLGQPMVALGRQADWGYVETIILPYFRERNYPGIEGRLRPPLPIAEEASYESSDNEWHTDLALRYSHYLGDLDFGIAYFNGTNREPIFRLESSGDLLRPHYELMQQVGLDLQYTRDAWLWKFEGLARDASSGFFLAAVVGFEYTAYQIGGSAADLGLLVEFHHDGRDLEQAPVTLYDNDLFLGTRFALNDAQDTSILAGTLIDADTETVIGLIESERRFGNSWKLEIVARIFAHSKGQDPAHMFRNDSFLNVSLSRYF